jgi:hypothetical protein
VVVSGTGQLGAILSSARFKRDVHNMNEASRRLMKLRPVTVHEKNEPTGIRQCDLIAE